MIGYFQCSLCVWVCVGGVKGNTHLYLCSLTHCSRQRRFWTLQVCETGLWRHWAKNLPIRSEMIQYIYAKCEVWNVDFSPCAHLPLPRPLPWALLYHKASFFCKEPDSDLSSPVDRRWRRSVWPLFPLKPQISPAAGRGLTAEEP